MGLLSFLTGLRLLERFRLKHRGDIFTHRWRLNSCMQRFKGHWTPPAPRGPLTRGSGVACTSQHDLYFWSDCDGALCCGFFFSLDSGSSFYPSFYLCFCSCSSSFGSLDFGSCFDFSFSWNMSRHIFKPSRFTDGGARGWIGRLTSCFGHRVHLHERTLSHPKQGWYKNIMRT